MSTIRFVALAPQNKPYTDAYRTPYTHIKCVVNQNHLRTKINSFSSEQIISVE